jgi:hypothetical protein
VKALLSSYQASRPCVFQWLSASVEMVGVGCPVTILMTPLTVYDMLLVLAARTAAAAAAAAGLRQGRCSC